MEFNNEDYDDYELNTAEDLYLNQPVFFPKNRDRRITSRHVLARTRERTSEYRESAQRH